MNDLAEMLADAKAQGYEQGREDTKRDILALCKESYHLKEVIDFLEQDLGAE